MTYRAEQGKGREAPQSRATVSPFLRSEVQS
jgi:hypothetical protein